MISSTIFCLALAAYHEARGEGPDGMLAVAEVVLNRVDHPDFPPYACAVVLQSCQFSFTCNSQSLEPRNEVAWRAAVEVAERAWEGDVLGHGATHFHRTGARPSWAGSFVRVGQVGNHIFYRDEGRCVLPQCSPRPVMRPQR
jgi:spore germination cell wall hydrolase CwlJ-like protein